MHDLQLNSLALKNFRCFEQLTIDFHPQLTVLVAENGAGKTSILDAIAVALGPFVGAFDDGVGPGFLPTDIRVRQVRQSSGNEMEYAPEGVSLVAKGRIPRHALDLDPDSPEKQWSRHLASPKKSKTTIKDAKVLVDCAKALQHNVRDGKTVNLPLLAYYGTNRLWQVRKLVAKKLAQTSRMVGYTDCLKSGSNYKIFCEWFRYWSNSAFAHAHRAAKQGVPEERSEFDDYIECVVQAISTCLAPSGWCCIQYDVGQEELVALHEDAGTMPVAQLSDGVRNMIGLVADMAFRATKLNPHLGVEAARETEGIVLIDEVDMHLHPSWQQTVLASLEEAFPKIQFIVTTHSPQVLTSVDASCIRKLSQVSEREDGPFSCVVESVTTQTRGVSSADLLARIMNVNPVPSVPEAIELADYEALIQQNLHESPEGLQLRAKLIDHFGSDHPVMRECERLIRLQAYKQRLPLSLGRTEG